jgi:pimeloyl-ACP methyl ester carboxylesterase
LFESLGKCNVVTLESKYTNKTSLIDVDGIFRNMRYLDINNVNDVNNEKIPTLLLMGTAQTISTYGPHLRGLSRNKRLIVPELRSQGETELLSKHCSMKQHVQDIVNFCNEMNIKKVDIVGFSFGGRVACALAANNPSLLGRLSLTGVPLVRPALGSLIINSWKESMIEGNIRDSAWSFVLNGYNDTFIEQNHHKLEQFVDIVVKNNDPIKLRDLLLGSNSQSQENYSVALSAEKIICPTQIIGNIYCIFYYN